MVECPIHKVAKTDRISGNECQSCEFFYDCPNNVLDDLENEIMEDTAVAIKAIKKILKSRIEGGRNDASNK